MVTVVKSYDLLIVGKRATLQILLLRLWDLSVARMLPRSRCGGGRAESPSGARRSPAERPLAHAAVCGPVRAESMCRNLLKTMASALFLLPSNVFYTEGNLLSD